MKILVACEFSGIVREAFKAKGHDVWSCDLLPTEIQGQHIQGSVLDVLNEGWDMMIAHPPCTYMCNSGVRWLHEDDSRWFKLNDAIWFFRKLYESSIAMICVENPIMHKYAIDGIGVNYSQIIQPWMFGHGETKATCLWLKNLPKLTPTNIVEGRDNRIHKMSPGKDRGKLRSITYQGIANAMAEQWSNL